MTNPRPYTFTLDEVRREACFLVGNIRGQQLTQRSLRTRVPEDFSYSSGAYSDAVLVWHYPQNYRYIARRDVYVDIKDHHNWVEADRVEICRAAAARDAMQYIIDKRAIHAHF